MNKAEQEALARAVSHDLRAPLRAIDGYTRMVLEEEGRLLTGEGRRKLGASLEAAAQLSAQIDAVVEYLRTTVEASRFESVDMNAIAEEALGRLRADGRLAGMEVEVAALPPAFGDRDALRALWWHLLDNAAKFSAKVASPRIRVTFEQAEGGTVYAVADNGAGFDPRHAGKLFGLFKRLHYADEFAGIGAGLALCRRIVELHGGRIGADAEPGKGATVHFNLPAKEKQGATGGTGGAY
jgi:light-regulated signal transduction histidine kinase (bacteriophytochrome)